MRNYGYLSANKRVASLTLLAKVSDAPVDVEEGESPEAGDELKQDPEAAPENTCPRCEKGVMISVKEFPRPTVHQVMQMTLDQLRQPRLPFM